MFQIEFYSISRIFNSFFLFLVFFSVKSTNVTFKRKYKFQFLMFFVSKFSFLIHTPFCTFFFIVFMHFDIFFLFFFIEGELKDSTQEAISLWLYFFFCF